MVLVSWCQFRRQTYLTPGSMECPGQQVSPLEYSLTCSLAGNIFKREASSRPSCFFALRAKVHPLSSVCVHYPPGILFVQIASTYWCVFKCDDYQMNHPPLAFDTVSLLPNHRYRGSPLITSLHYSSHLLFLPGPFED